MNEPCDPQQIRVSDFYERLEKAIRVADPHHMLFLDGNIFAMEWKGFNTILPNTVYSTHDYSMMGFPIGERYKGTEAQNDKLVQQYNRKCEFHHTHGVPIWVGEFGPTYESRDADKFNINQERFNLLGRQLSIYGDQNVSWTIWMYKDIGHMGMVSTSPNSPYLKMIQPFLDRKVRLQLDSASMQDSDEVDHLIDPLVEWINRVSPAATKMYPSNWDTRLHIRRNVLQTFLAASLTEEFAELFKGLGKDQLDELARSWELDQCVLKPGLNDVVAQTTT